MAAPEVPPTRARMIASALAVLALVLALWGWIEYRSAPPPAPPVVLPTP